MSGSISINTDKVQTAATGITNANNSIRASFSTLESSVKSLNMAWDGSASEQAMTAFAKIKNDFEDTRYKVMNNYVTFLVKQVGEGYIQTETTNTSLAEAFK